MIKAGATKLGDASVLVAEATGLRNRVQAAYDMGSRRHYIEGDSTSVIQALRVDIISPWSISNIIKDTGIFLSKCVVINVNHTFREGNSATDWIANEGHRAAHNFSISTV